MGAKYILSILMLMLGSLTHVSYAYFSQGFASYQEQGNTINFVCQGQCAIALGKKETNNLLKITNLTGQGMVIIGVLDAKKNIYPLGQHPVGDIVTYVDMLGTQPIPNEAELVINFQGNISSNTQATINLTISNRIDDVMIMRNTFRSKEGQTFYGINLRYGVKFGSTSIVYVGYIFFILGMRRLRYKKLFRLHNILLLGLGLYLFIAIRNQIDYSLTTWQGLQSYTLADSSKKSYGNLGDYYDFVSQARVKIGLTAGNTISCKVLLDCSQSRPYCSHMETVFIRPCETTTDVALSDYQIYYKKTPNDPVGKQILEYQGSYLYQSK